MFFLYSESRSDSEACEIQFCYMLVLLALLFHTVTETETLLETESETAGNVVSDGIEIDISRKTPISLLKTPLISLKQQKLELVFKENYSLKK